MLSLQNNTVYEEVFHNSNSKYILFCTVEHVWLQQDQQKRIKSMAFWLSRQFTSSTANLNGQRGAGSQEPQWSWAQSPRISDWLKFCKSFGNLALTLFQGVVLSEATNAKNKWGQGNEVHYRNLFIGQLLCERKIVRCSFGRLGNLVKAWA